MARIRGDYVAEKIVGEAKLGLKANEQMSK